VAAKKQSDRDIRDAMRIVVRLARVAEHQCRESGLTLPQYRALAFVARGTRRAAEIADAAAVSRPAITALVGGLVNVGLLKRDAVPGDRRGVHITLTARGRRVLTNTEKSLITRFSSVFGKPKEVATLLTELAKLEDTLDADIEWATTESNRRPQARRPPRKKARA